MLVVQKYGGTSVADAECIMRVAKRIKDTFDKGHQVVVVLSAQGHTTDELLAKAHELNPAGNKRELDMLLSTGEVQSAALMAIALHKLKAPAISLNARQAGIHATTTHGNARIKKIDIDRVEKELQRNNIVLVAGFQGINRYHDVTTLGRGASDTTAVAIAAVLGADICEIYTDVDGIYTADPRKVASAKKLNEITYDEMLELASQGAEVLHNRAVEMAKRNRVKLVVRSSMSDAEGTTVKERVMERQYVSGVALDEKVARISLVGLEDRPGIAYRIFSMLGKKKISVDIILQSIGRESSKDISFTIAREHLEQAAELLEARKEEIGFALLDADAEIAKLSAVGAGMASDPGVASMMFEALYDAGVNISMISTSEIKISVLIAEKDAQRALKAVHDKFVEQHVVKR